MEIISLYISLKNKFFCFRICLNKNGKSLFSILIDKGIFKPFNGITV